MPRRKYWITKLKAIANNEKMKPKLSSWKAVKYVAVAVRVWGYYNRRVVLAPTVQTSSTPIFNP